MNIHSCQTAECEREGSVYRRPRDNIMQTRVRHEALIRIRSRPVDAAEEGEGDIVALRGAGVLDCQGKGGEGAAVEVDGVLGAGVEEGGGVEGCEVVGWGGDCGGEGGVVQAVAEGEGGSAGVPLICAAGGAGDVVGSQGHVCHWQG